jgi:hypothetical protein
LGKLTFTNHFEEFSMPAELLNTFVQLAKLGVSGVCIASIACVTWLLWKRTSIDDRTAGVMRLFMRMCTVMTVTFVVLNIVQAYTGWDELPTLAAERNQFEIRLKELSKNYAVLEDDVERFDTRQKELKENFQRSGMAIRLVIIRFNIAAKVIGLHIDVNTFDEFMKLAEPRLVARSPMPYSLKSESQETTEQASKDGGGTN